MTASLVLIGLTVAVIALGIVSRKRHTTIKEQRTAIERYQAEIGELKDYNKRLAEINGIQVSVTFQLTQKNVLSQVNTNAQAIAKEICQLTRQQVLDSLTVYTNPNYSK